jgi:hypothetical protein
MATIVAFHAHPDDEVLLTGGLTMTWSSGPAGGRVNHIKVVKRLMFGRAGLPLLRKRVLLTARVPVPTREVAAGIAPERNVI